MTIEIIYLLAGVVIGVIIRYESEVKTKKKIIERKIERHKAIASCDAVMEYDEMLESFKNINKALMAVEKKKKKEVV